MPTKRVTQQEVNRSIEVAVMTPNVIKCCAMNQLKCSEVNLER